MADTYAQMLEKAKTQYSALLDEKIEEYSEEEIRVRKHKLADLERSIAWLEQKAGDEASKASGRSRFNHVTFGSPH